MAIIKQTELEIHMIDGEEIHCFVDGGLDINSKHQFLECVLIDDKPLIINKSEIRKIYPTVQYEKENTELQEKHPDFCERLELQNKPKVLIVSPNKECNQKLASEFLIDEAKRRLKDSVDYLDYDTRYICIDPNKPYAQQLDEIEKFCCGHQYMAVCFEKNVYPDNLVGYIKSRVRNFK